MKIDRWNWSCDHGDDDQWWGSKKGIDNDDENKQCYNTLPLVWIDTYINIPSGNYFHFAMLVWWSTHRFQMFLHWFTHIYPLTRWSSKHQGPAKVHCMLLPPALRPQNQRGNGEIKWHKIKWGKRTGLDHWYLLDPWDSWLLSYVCFVQGSENMLTHQRVKQSMRFTGIILGKVYINN